MKISRQMAVADQEIDLKKAIAETLEKLLAPVAEAICEMEMIRRKEYLTEREAALLFSLSAATLKTLRSRGGGPAYLKIGSKVLYPRQSLVAFFSYASEQNKTPL